MVSKKCPFTTGEIMEALARIADIGIEEALRRLIPHVREAGALARTLQPLVKAEYLADPARSIEKGGSNFGSALTEADLLVEDFLGGKILQMFSDASFHGEEYQRDRISRFIPKGRPYIITLDPINGTLYYRDGLPLYECIINICTVNWEILGTIVYSPETDDCFFGWCDRERGKTDVRRRTWWGGVCEENSFRIDPQGKTRNIYLEKGMEAEAGERVKAAGFIPVFPYRDYARQPGWTHHFLDVLTGETLGSVRKDSQLIDHASICFLVEGAGGIWHSRDFSKDTLRFGCCLVAANNEVAKLLSSLV